MHVFIQVGSLTIPSYGLLIALGVVIANLISLIVLRRTGQNVDEFILLEAYGILGGFIGSKLLYLLVSFKEVDWLTIKDFESFNNLMRAGFVFYGGLILGLMFLFMGGQIHHIKYKPYIRNFIFVIPLIHGFGRVGCFMAGCCYGIPYEGVGAVVFPENSYGLSGVSLFPVQLVEAAGLLIMALILFLLSWEGKNRWTVELYLLMYGILRFCVEFVRYDDIRGYWGVLSTSQWISIILVIVAVVSIMVHQRLYTEE